MTNQSGPYISVLGDSISTFENYTPDSGVFYFPAFSQRTNIASVEDTWWMQVIHGLGGHLLSNDSHAGSSISSTGYQPANAPWRLARLKKGDCTPEIILIYSGLNDVAMYVPPEEFGAQYYSMLQHAKELFPSAKIYCGSLCRGFQRELGYPVFVNLDACLPLSEYNYFLRKAVETANCFLVDLAAFEEQYSTLDSVHPDAEGMKTLSSLWLKEIKPK